MGRSHTWGLTKCGVWGDMVDVEKQKKQQAEKFIHVAIVCVPHQTLTS